MPLYAGFVGVFGGKIRYNMVARDSKTFIINYALEIIKLASSNKHKNSCIITQR
jgi:hypothetical protein